MKHRNHGGDAIDPLKAEPKVNQHAQQGVEHRQLGLGLQLFSDLRADDAHIPYAKIGEEERLLQRRNHCRIDNAFQFVE